MEFVVERLKLSFSVLKSRPQVEIITIFTLQAGEPKITNPAVDMRIVPSLQVSLETEFLGSCVHLMAKNDAVGAKRAIELPRWSVFWRNPLWAWYRTKPFLYEEHRVWAGGVIRRKKGWSYTYSGKIPLSLTLSQASVRKVLRIWVVELLQENLTLHLLYGRKTLDLCWVLSSLALFNNVRAAQTILWLDVRYLAEI